MKPRCSAHRQQLTQHRCVAGRERAAVARHVRPFRQRVDRQDALERPVVDVGMQDRRGLALPCVLEVALVGDEERPTLPRPGDHLAEVVGAQNAAVRVGRRVDEDDGGSHRSEPDRGIRRHHLALRVPGSDLVRRVGELRHDDQVVGTEPQLGREVADELLGADGRQHLVGDQTRDAEATLQPVDRRLAHGGRAMDGRVAVGVRSFGERFLDRVGSRVDRRADREVDQSVGMSSSDGLRLGDRVPGELREPRRNGAGPRPPTPGIRTRRAHSWFCGGSAAMIGWSRSRAPVLAAPPGEPISSKKCTLAS